MHCEEIISRENARERGLARYFTGQPCKHGHLVGRLVSDTKCCECLRLKTRRLHKDWRDRNKDRIKEYSQTYLAKDGSKEIRQLAQKNRQEKNRKSINAYAREYRIKNLERCRENQRKWCATNSDKRRVDWQNRKSRRKNAAGAFSASDIRDLLKQQHSKCAYYKVCGFWIKDKKYHIDHIIALANGGTNFRSNLQLLCPRCNLAKSAKDPIVFSQELGFLL